MLLKYKSGDATAPDEQGKKLLIHLSNDQNAFDAGFVLSLSRRWSEPEHTYRQSFIDDKNNKLGDVQFVQVEKDLYVANMVGQTLGYHKDSGGNMVPPIRYDAIQRCLAKVRNYFILNRFDCIVCPKWGAGLAGGDWQVIERLMREILSDYNIPVIVYELL